MISLNLFGRAYRTAFTKLFFSFSTKQALLKRLLCKSSFQLTYLWVKQGEYENTSLFLAFSLLSTQKSCEKLVLPNIYENSFSFTGEVALWN
jgi:hypothetical protein